MAHDPEAIRKFSAEIGVFERAQSMRVNSDCQDQMYSPLFARAIEFGEALALLRQGKKVSRKGWNGKGMWLKLQIPDAMSEMSKPYIFIKTVDAALVPWVASHGDLLGADWQVEPE